MIMRSLCVLSFLVASTVFAQSARVSALNQLIATNPPHLDFVIQNVCVDGQDNVIEGDPAFCPRHRNIRLGEKVPYLVTDRDAGNGERTYQALSSYPIMGTDGQLKVMVAKNMQANFTSDFSFDFNEARDGYDLLDVNAGHVSVIRTSDGGCFDQKISASARTRSGGWFFFPRSMGAGSLVHSIVLERLSPQRPAHCEAVGRSSNVHAVWNAPTPQRFESGKVLSTLVSYHFAHKTLGRKNNALERFFFTREYGFTRWEAWIPLSRCREDFANDPRRCDPAHIEGRCGSADPFPGTADWGNQAWVRTDCRDSTNYIAVSKPFVPLTKDMGTKNGLVDVDIQASFAPKPLGSWSGNGNGSHHLPGVGFPRETSWQVLANGREQIMTYGPYVSDLPAGKLSVEFTLEVDNNSADNVPVARVDVYRNSTQTLLGQLTLRRRDFTTARQPQTFTLPVDHDGSGELEFRVISLGNSALTHVRTQVFAH